MASVYVVMEGDSGSEESHVVAVKSTIDLANAEVAKTRDPEHQPRWWDMFRVDA